MSLNQHSFGLNLLSVYDEEISRKMALLYQTLKIFQTLFDNPSTWSMPFVQENAYFFKDQTNNISQVFELCKKWRNLSPTQQELKQITDIERNALFIEVIYNHIVKLSACLVANTAVK